MSDNSKYDTEKILLSSGVSVDVKVEKKFEVNKEEEDERINRYSSMRNTTSSVAAAGSNFFHSYRKIRQLEEERLGRMEEEYQKETEKSEFNKQRERRILSCIESTKRKSERRKRKRLKCTKAKK
ncbi:hypothetical protein FG386_002080 [Cryptosporidium ryanae]|uniref:uncharacterized protein n=1 Tax=Cryptosporidium ryanae TaxID=515981 RepID=UPI003519FC5F|nr:hypothetical protein FG386_002080 [Cryptosporidium ryanae]